MCKQSSGMEIARLVLLVAEPEMLLVLHYLLEAILRNHLLSSGHTAFSVHVALFCVLLNFLQATYNIVISSPYPPPPLENGIPFY